MKRRFFRLFSTLSLLLVFVGSGILPYVELPKASASPGDNYTLYYTDDAETRGALLAAAKDGGIGDSDAHGILTKTTLYTKGGRLGTTSLSFNPDFSNKNDIPTYSRDYYCYPTKRDANGQYNISTETPDSSLPYVRYTMGVTLLDNNDWKGIAGDGPYKTYVGVLGNSYVGTVHFPQIIQDSGDGNIPPKDFKLPGKGGDHDVRTKIEFDESQGRYYGKEDGTTDYSFDKYDPKLPGYDHIGDVFDGCMPNPRGDLGKVTTKYSKDPAKADWDQAIRDANLGNDVATAATSARDDASGSDEVPSLQCKAGFNPLNWLICGIVSGLVSIIGQVDNTINSLLSVGTNGSSDDPNQIFCNSSTDQNYRSTCSSYHKAWSSFRDISLGLIVIAGLIILIAQALGMELLDAYTIRKVLPRLLIAAIAITLSWQLMQFFVQMTNALGLGIRNLIYFPFKDTFTNTVDLGGAEDLGVTLATAGAITAMGIFGLLSFVGTAALAVLIGFLILVVRQLVIIMLIVLAPIAIMLYILPNTQNTYKLWWESFSKALLMFPLITGLIAAGRVFSAVAAQQGQNGDNPVNSLIAFAAYFAPYFALPLTFKFAGGALRQIGGFVNDRGRGGFDRLRNFRAGQVQKNMKALQQGKRYEGKRWIPGSIRAAEAFNETTKGIGTGWTGRFGYGRRGALARRNMDQQAGAEAMQSEGMKAVAGWNDVNRVLATGMGDERRGREALKHHLMNGGDLGDTFLSEEAAEARVEQAVRAAKVAGGFSKANGIAGFMNMARDGTAIRDTDDLAKLAATVGQGDRNNTFKYAAEGASISRQAGRSDLAAASEPIGDLAFAYSDEEFHNNLAPAGADKSKLSYAAWASGAGGEVAYTKYSTAKGRTVRNDTRKAVDILKEHREAHTNGVKSPYSPEQVRFAAATLVDAQNAIANQYGRLNNRKDAAAELAKDEGALEWYLDTKASVPDQTNVGGFVDDGTPIQASSAKLRTTTEREIVNQIVGDRYASLTPEQRRIAEQQRDQDNAGGP